jgi:hypothetical protein
VEKAVDDATADLDAFGDAGEGCHRHRRLADQSTFGLPNGIEAFCFGVLREFHAFANAVGVL